MAVSEEKGMAGRRRIADAKKRVWGHVYHQTNVWYGRKEETTAMSAPLAISSLTTGHGRSVIWSSGSIAGSVVGKFCLTQQWSSASRGLSDTSTCS